jgi:GNAT superfamily N-acetyltransferase
MKPTKDSRSTLYDAHCQELTPANRSQYRQVAAIDKACGVKPMTLQEYSDELRKQGNIGIAISLDGEIVGYAMARMTSIKVTLNHMVVAPEYRRRNVARMILRCIDEKLLKAKRVLEFVVREDDMDSLMFLKACGIEATGEVLPGVERDSFVFVTRGGFSKGFPEFKGE